MNLELIDSRSIKVGRGNTHGYTKVFTYRCPCGSGTVTYEIDDIVGWKNWDIHCDCHECNEKYRFRRGGTAIEKQ